MLNHKREKFSKSNSLLMFGTVLGVSAGFAPGPLLALVITETLQHDVKSGIKVAMAPIITDLPIIVLTLFLLSKLASFHSILGVISLVGGGFILYQGGAGLQVKGLAFDPQAERPRSLAKGILANILTYFPHPIP